MGRAGRNMPSFLRPSGGAVSLNNIVDAFLNGHKKEEEDPHQQRGPDTNDSSSRRPRSEALTSEFSWCPAKTEGERGAFRGCFLAPVDLVYLDTPVFFLLV